MHRGSFLRTAICALALALPALAAFEAQAQAASTRGEVVRVDRAAGRVTLKHGEIKHLDMPPMTMAYQVASPSLLEGLAAGDRVRFTAERLEGRHVVTALVKAP
ncbi:conserved exported hypothetical protein [Rubrivivax sp. A210]|uniref:copper-binding protein n=1 Tax=Rubrivivax sp. A210 TaxID=2772301 RepID=UPI00191A15FB|nr:copper-binding protein [Rubrivivax sp. A210]CAD5372548.1 conserved exported hypothetical protein [Rubrivivax sp. A210]